MGKQNTMKDMRSKTSVANAKSGYFTDHVKQFYGYKLYANLVSNMRQLAWSFTVSFFLKKLQPMAVWLHSTYNRVF